MKHKKHKKKKSFNPYWLIVIILIVILAVAFTQKSSSKKENVLNIEFEEEAPEEEAPPPEDNPFEVEPKVIPEEVPVETPEENETAPAAGGSGGGSSQEEEIIEETQEEPFVKDVNRSDLYVLDGDFEMEDNYLENIRDYDNYAKTGYVYMRNSLSPINGEKDLKVKVAVAKKESYNRPAFIADLSRDVQKDNDYVVTLLIRTVKGTPDLYGLGFGETIYAYINYEDVDERTTKYTFDMSSDVTSDEMYIYFNGTTIKEFRVDDIEIY